MNLDTTDTDVLADIKAWWNEAYKISRTQTTGGGKEKNTRSRLSWFILPEA